MPNKKNYNNNCFSPNWIEFNWETVQTQQKEVNEFSQADYELVHTEARKEILESKNRKNLDTLVKELEEIKQNIARVAEKQHRLANLMKYYYYSEELAQ